MLQIGQVIANRYYIIRQLGSGGTSVVYLAADKHLNKNFALKEIRKDDYVYSGDITGKLINEANIMNRLNHPLLPRIIDVLDSGRTVYVVMDYIEGTTLDEVMKRRGMIPEPYVVHWFRQLCEVLTYLHTSTPPIIFRDLKPSNIILTPDGSIRLIDFGAAMDYKKSDLQRGVQAPNFGTRGYAAPEQVMMNGRVDARTDIYSLGVTMHYLLTGIDPTNPTNRLVPIRQVNPQFSPALEQIIIKCTQTRPADRFANCRELFFELDKLHQPDRSAQKKKSSALAIVTAVVSLVVFFITMAIFLVGSMGQGAPGLMFFSEIPGILQALFSLPIVFF